MEKQFVMSMFANRADLEQAKAEYVAKNKAVASAAGFSVMPSEGGFAYAKTEGFTGKFPEWLDGFETEEAAWEAAAKEAAGQ